jgi:hypothetical protein
MLVNDVIHRLRIRANEARDHGQMYLAEDLRLAIVALEQLEREAALGRRPKPAPEQPSAVTAEPSSSCHQATR